MSNEVTPGGDPIKEMDKAIYCLALELPESIHTDVSQRWAAAKAAITGSQVSGGEGAPAKPHECGWTDTARDFCNGMELYRNLLDECAKYLGEATYRSDDGSIQDSPVRLNIPGLVEKLAKCAPAVPDALTWTREKPTVEGWYWALIPNAEPEVGEVVKQNNGGWFYFPADGGMDAALFLEDMPWAQWAGPLPEPREAPPAPMNEGEVK